jgi:hypothetical protein
LWEAFLDPSDSYFLFAEGRGYHRWALARSSSCLFKQFGYCGHFPCKFVKNSVLLNSFSHDISHIQILNWSMPSSKKHVYLEKNKWLNFNIFFLNSVIFLTRQV